MKNYKICKSYETTDEHVHEFFMVCNHFYGKSGFSVRYTEHGGKVTIEVTNRRVSVKAGRFSDINYNKKKLAERLSGAEAEAIAKAVKEHHESAKTPFTDVLESAEGFVYASEYEDYCKAAGIQPEILDGQTENQKLHRAAPVHEREDR